MAAGNDNYEMLVGTIMLGADEYGDFNKPVVEEGLEGQSKQPRIKTGVDDDDLVETGDGAPAYGQLHERSLVAAELPPDAGQITQVADVSGTKPDHPAGDGGVEPDPHHSHAQPTVCPEEVHLSHLPGQELADGPIKFKGDAQLGGQHVGRARGDDGQKTARLGQAPGDLQGVYTD